MGATFSFFGRIVFGNDFIFNIGAQIVLVWIVVIVFFIITNKTIIHWRLQLLQTKCLFILQHDEQYHAFLWI